MRILIDGNSLEKMRAGIGNYTYALFVNLLAIDQENEYTLIIRHLSKELTVSLPDSLNYIASNRNSLRYLPFDIEKLTNHFDLYHEPNYIPRMFGGKTIVTIHDVSYRLFPQYHPWRRVAKLRLFERRIHKAEHILTDSENSKHQIKEMLKIPEDMITVTYLGVDEQFRPLALDDVKKQILKKTYGLPERFFLYVGTLEPRKNLSRLVDAYNAFRNENLKEDIKLVLAGGKGWLYESIFNRVQELNLVNDIIFTGYIADEDLPYLYNLSLAFVYPSLYEGFGLPPLEAMSCGIPVISSNASSLPEVVGNAGIMVDPLRVDDIAAAMLLVFQSQTLRDNLSIRGLEQAKKFSWKRCAEETLQVYKNCLN